MPPVPTHPFFFFLNPQDETRPSCCSCWRTTVSSLFGSISHAADARRMCCVMRALLFQGHRQHTVLRQRYDADRLRGVRCVAGRQCEALNIQPNGYDLHPSHSPTNAYVYTLYPLHSSMEAYVYTVHPFHSPHRCSLRCCNIFY